MRGRRKLVVLGAVAAAGIAAAALVWQRESHATYADGDAGDRQQVALGAEVYKAHCASCHGAHLEGQPNWRQRKPDGRLPAPPHDYHGHTWRHPDKDLFGMVKKGIAAYAPPGYQSDMMGFAGVLSDKEIWAVIAFIKSSWPPEFRTYQRKITEGARPSGE